MFDDAINILAAEVLAACRRRGLMMVIAESCTGGLVASALTAVSGSSDVVDRGYVTYSYDSKTEMLGVPRDLIMDRGAVSEAVARAMSIGVLARHPGRIAVAVTGVAGPGSDSQAKPAGLVHFAAGLGGEIRHLERRYGDVGRDAVRQAAVCDALSLVLELCA
ncbi:MAG: CinA family protein [Rhodospirillales bacterium]|nr:CinA family protein [Rhodospirillales bacterium]